jgi:hypothetical protein
MNAEHGDLDALAAAMIVALDAGYLDIAEATRAIDAEIAKHPDPPLWLIDASLAIGPEDVLHCLRGRAAAHPMLSDAWAALDAMGRAIARGRAVMEIAPRIDAIYPYGEWPAELKQPLDDLYEELHCAHNHGGVTLPEYVEVALHALLSAARGKNRWSALFDWIGGAATAHLGRSGGGE